jgi:hypothetical protein
MLQTAMDLNLTLKHLEVGSLELLQVYHLYRVPLVLLQYLHSFEDVAAITPAQLVLGIVFVLTDTNLTLFERSADRLLACERTRDGGFLLKGPQIFPREISHMKYYLNGSQCKAPKEAFIMTLTVSYKVSDGFTGRWLKN